MPKLTKLVKLSVLYGVLIGAGLGSGLAAATLYQSWQRRSEQAGLIEKSLGFVGTELKEIEVGRPFPDVPLRSIPGNEPMLVRDLLPGGGLLYYIDTECGSCRIAASDVAARNTLSAGANLPIVVIAIGSIEAAQTLVFETGLPFPVLVDVEKSLAMDYGVVMFPSYFCLGENQVIHSYGSEIRTADQLAMVVDMCRAEFEEDVNESR